MDYILYGIKVEGSGYKILTRMGKKMENRLIGGIMDRRNLKEMKFYCLFNKPYVSWRIYK